MAKRCWTEFTDGLWLEDGLARNTLDSYRRDLRQFGQLAPGRLAAAPCWKRSMRTCWPISPTGSRSKGKASSTARLLSSLKRFYR